VVLLFCIAWVQLAFWRSNKISPQFHSASQRAYQLIRQCDDRINQEGASFDICINNAEKTLGQLATVARTHRERIQYALVGSYLRTVRDCRKDWEKSDVSPDAKDRLNRLLSSRRDLERRLSEQ